MNYEEFDDVLILEYAFINIILTKKLDFQVTYSLAITDQLRKRTAFLHNVLSDFMSWSSAYVAGYHNCMGVSDLYVDKF